MVRAEPTVGPGPGVCAEPAVRAGPDPQPRVPRRRTVLPPCQPDGPAGARPAGVPPGTTGPAVRFTGSRATTGVGGSSSAHPDHP